MKIEKQIPTFHPPQRQLQDGSIINEYYLDEGLVTVRAYPGGQQHHCFTTVTLWLTPYFFTARFIHCYHRRWHHRLARDFAWHCAQEVLK